MQLDDEVLVNAGILGNNHILVDGGFLFVERFDEGLLFDDKNTSNISQIDKALESHYLCSWYSVLKRPRELLLALAINLIDSSFDENWFYVITCFLADNQLAYRLSGIFVRLGVCRSVLLVRMCCVFSVLP